MGSTDIALPIYMRGGFRYIKSIPRFVKVIDFKKIKKFSIFNTLAIKLMHQWNFKYKQKNKYTVLSIKDKRYDGIFLTNLKRNTTFFKRFVS